MVTINRRNTRTDGHNTRISEIYAFKCVTNTIQKARIIYGRKQLLSMDNLRVVADPGTFISLTYTYFSNVRAENENDIVAPATQRTKSSVLDMRPVSASHIKYTRKWQTNEP